MKKILSSILATVLLASAAIVPVVAEKSYTASIDVPYMSQKPTFDGAISEGEWGKVSVTVDGSTAAVPGSEKPSDYNTFAHYEHTYDSLTQSYSEIDETGKAKVTSISFDLWLRWDTEYFYMAAEVDDPDGYCLPSGRGSVWNGDCLQFRVDPMGPNSYLTYKNPEYDYTAAAFDYEAASGNHYMPWAYRTKTCNIGLGMVKNAKGEWDYQAYDMADNGTGNLTSQIQINDPVKLGPDGATTKSIGLEGTNLSSEFMMTQGNGKNVYEIAVPWAYLDQWKLNQAAVGSVWGISVVALLGDVAHQGYYAYLTWGSGICGAQQDEANLRTTIGGSNAMILTDKDALTGETVANLPVYTEEIIPPGEVINYILDGRGMNAYYLGSTEEITVSDGDFSVYMDVAYIGDYATNPERTHIGFRLGEGYGKIAGWDGDTGEFFITTSLWQNGIDKSVPYAVSDDVFEWTPGEWHNLGLVVKDNYAAVIFDGEIVVEDEDASYNCGLTTSYQILHYNLGDFVLDNFELYDGAGTTLADYSFNSDDEDYSKSDFNLQTIPNSFESIVGECKELDPESDYGCLMKPGKNADGKSCMICSFCGKEGELLAIAGDADGSGVVNLLDASLILKKAAMWDVEIDEVAADVTGDGKINLLDASATMKIVAGWK